MKIIKRVNSAKKSPISALRNYIMPNVHTIEINTSDQKRRSAAPCITVCQEQCGVVSNKELFELLNLTKPKVTPLFFDTLPDITIKI